MNTGMRVFSGKPYPLGATWDGRGVNFALFSANAEKVLLCLFDPTGTREVQRIALPERTDEVWHVYLPNVEPGQLYGYRVFGPYDPERGHRFNHNKLLLDPYAKAITDNLSFQETMLGFRFGSPKADMSFDRRDSAPFVPKCIVVDDSFYWNGDKIPQTPWNETVIYETHLKGFTFKNPEIEEHIRGTFAGMAAPEAVNYLKGLGITSVELLPIQAFFSGKHLKDGGLSNYWGYDPLCYFAPQPSYMAGRNISEVKDMVRVFHDAGIEVLMDVVYNHTGEGNQMGPTLCFRGIDNAVYYRLQSSNPRYYDDTTGCGASFNVEHPRVTQLVMDSLRYWVENMHIDGFRFDLAPTLARTAKGFTQNAGFLTAVQQDPVLQRVKMIAEPWDIGLGGYQLGAFPPGWAEWNDRFRDTVRLFWKGDKGQIGNMASRLTGSSETFNYRGRRPWTSINFVTAHDGFTLRDVVSYNEKHNMANGENNRDGTDNNRSWNSGVEGETSDPAVLSLRRRRMRGMMATLLLSLGTPMMVAGDEFCRTQKGNNNAYCQDSPISWLNWGDITEQDAAFRDFVKFLLKLRSEHWVFRRKRYYSGKKSSETEIKDITWMTPEGLEMSSSDWDKPYAQSLSALLSGALNASFCNDEGLFSSDNHFFMILNAYDEEIEWTLPELKKQMPWRLILDTSRDNSIVQGENFEAGSLYNVPAWSFLLFDTPVSEEEKAELHAKQGATGILGNFNQKALAGRLVATPEDLDRLDFLMYGPMGPVATPDDFDDDTDEGFTKLI